MTRTSLATARIQDGTMDHDPGIVFVIDSLVPQGGMEKALMGVANELSPERSVLIVVLSGPEVPSGLFAANIPLLYLNVSQGRTRLLRSVIPLRRALRASSDPAASVVAVGLWCTTILSWARRWDMDECVVWEHSVTEQRLAASWKMRVLWKLAEPAIRRADVVVCVSEPVKRVAERVQSCAPRVVVIPNMVSQNRRQKAVDTGPREDDVLQLLGIGSLAPVKSWETAIRALAYLPGRVTLKIAGEGPELASLSKLAHALGLAERVDFLGYQDDVGALLASSDVLVHPSLSETFGYALLEATEAGVPVVVRDYPVMSELVPRYIPGIVAGDEPRDFAAAIGKAARLRAHPERWASTAAIRESAFGREQVAMSWRNLLSLASGDGPPRRSPA